MIIYSQLCLDNGFKSSSTNYLPSSTRGGRQKNSESKFHQEAFMVSGQSEEAAFVVFSCNHVIVTSQHIGHYPSCKKKILNE